MRQACADSKECDMKNLARTHNTLHTRFQPRGAALPRRARPSRRRLAQPRDGGGRCAEAHGRDPPGADRGRGRAQQARGRGAARAAVPAAGPGDVDPARVGAHGSAAAARHEPARGAASRDRCSDGGGRRAGGGGGDVSFSSFALSSAGFISTSASGMAIRKDDGQV